MISLHHHQMQKDPCIIRSMSHPRVLALTLGTKTEFSSLRRQQSDKHASFVELGTISSPRRARHDSKSIHNLDK